MLDLLTRTSVGSWPCKAASVAARRCSRVRRRRALRQRVISGTPGAPLPRRIMYSRNERRRRRSGRPRRVTWTGDVTTPRKSTTGAEARAAGARFGGGLAFAGLVLASGAGSASSVRSTTISSLGAAARTSPSIMSTTTSGWRRALRCSSMRRRRTATVLSACSKTASMKPSESTGANSTLSSEDRDLSVTSAALPPPNTTPARSSFGGQRIVNGSGGCRAFRHRRSHLRCGDERRSEVRV